MKVLELTCHFSPNVGGVETHLDDLVKALIKRSFEVMVLTYQPLTTDTSWKMIEYADNLKIVRIPWIKGFFYKLIKHPLLEFLYLFPGIFLTTPFAVYFHDPDTIHAHGIVASFVAVFWGRLLGRRVISTTHSIYSFPKNGIYRKFVVWVFRNCNYILTLSRQSKNEIESLGIEPDKIKNFTYWIDLDRFKPEGSKVKTRKDLKLPGGFIALFVGRLVEEKGVRVLLESRWAKNVYLVIVGEGPLETFVKRKAALNKNILVLGKKSQSELPKLYASVDLLIVPSVNEEGFGRVICESLACGTPVLGSNIGGIPEAMDESVGLLVSPSSTSFSTAVNTLKRKKRLLKKLSKNARPYAIKHYSERNVNIIISTYV